jgi:hypothetical protein
MLLREFDDAQNVLDGTQEDPARPAHIGVNARRSETGGEWPRAAAGSFRDHERQKEEQKTKELNGHDLVVDVTLALRRKPS